LFSSKYTISKQSILVYTNSTNLFDNWCQCNRLYRYMNTDSLHRYTSLHSDMDGSNTRLCLKYTSTLIYSRSIKRHICSTTTIAPCTNAKTMCNFKICNRSCHQTSYITTLLLVKTLTPTEDCLISHWYCVCQFLNIFDNCHYYHPVNRKVFSK